MYDLVIFNSYDELMKDEYATGVRTSNLCWEYVQQLLPVYIKCGLTVVVLPHKEEHQDG